LAQPIVIFQPEGRRTRIGVREDLLDAARRCGVGLEDLCAGRGTCGKCKVLVRRGEQLLKLPSPHEEHLSREDRERGVRLACQARPAGEGIIVLEVPPEAQRSWQRLQTTGLMPACAVRPSVRLVPASRNLPRAGLRRRGLRVSPAVGSMLERISRAPAGAWRFVAYGREVIGVQRASEPLLGMAFDIGSTKIAGFLVDLVSGQLLETVSAPNPQMVHGEDIMSRLAFALASSDQEASLHREVVAALDRLLTEACARAKLREAPVSLITAVGNTAMQHLFLGVPVAGLARAPYTPSTQRQEERPAASLGFEGSPSARVIAPPVVAAFVGSDLVAGVLSTRMHRARGLRVFIDVGTNTEICAGDRQRLVTCSTPSGPAFEGAHIRFGMRAADGAVERVAIEAETLHVDYRTIGRLKPRGLCGSALLDLLAELYLAGAIDSTGRLRTGAGRSRIRKKGREAAFVIVPKEETSIGQDIVLTQNDIGQLQLAKAAIHAGIEILLDELRASYEDIGAVYMAGAFGSYLAPESARTVGMLPDLPLERIQFVGNTAGSGARLSLLSRAELEMMRHLARSIRHLPLAGDPRFPRAFAAALPLPHRNAKLYPSVTPGRRRRKRAR
jgi:uncharacterized 2Fe-2S/4Fe-4S cluster protein (DUF4445 family)